MSDKNNYICFDVLDSSSSKVGEFEASSLLFSQGYRLDLLHRMINYQLAKKRQGTHSTKTVSAVSGSNRKVSKIPGRARRGTNKDPQCRGGGVVFGPHPRSYFFKLPKKVRKKSLLIALSIKHKENKILLMDKFPCEGISTKKVFSVIKKLSVNKGLFVFPSQHDHKNFLLSIRNIPHNKVISDVGINVYDIMRYEHLIMTPEVIKNLEKRLVS